jgi:hypothetical protein
MNGIGNEEEGKAFQLISLTKGRREKIRVRT